MLKKFQRIIFADNNNLEHKYILSYHPSIPLYPWPNNAVVDFYIDATNLQIFNNYGCGTKIDNKFKLKVINREKAAYKAAGKIICMCQWAADSVINDYGINSKKVHVVVGGPNLEEEILDNKKILYVLKSLLNLLLY